MATTLVLGAARSGRSRHAKSLLAGQDRVTVLVLGPRDDPDAEPEWAERAERDRQERPEGWSTVETTDLIRGLISARSPVLVEGLSTWVGSVVDQAGSWADAERAHELVLARLEELKVAWRGVPFDIVAVSDEAGWGSAPTTPEERLHRDLLAVVNTCLSAISHRIHLVVAGRVLDLSEAPVVGQR